jgi:glyoxylase-like metal-dependent hydrolase (beta-lactamase superfamily II)
MALQKKIGDIEVTALSDGLYPASLDALIDFEPAESQRLTGTSAGDTLHLAVNSYLLKLGPTWALVDTGCGPLMGSTLGHLAANLRAFGVAPEAIDHVLLTHIHPDHANGLVDANGRAVYPNAELIVHEKEAAFWLDRDESTGPTERIRRNIAKARVTTGPYRDRLRTVPDGEAVPGISAVLLAGHTPGHTGWLIHSGRDSVLIWGDVVHLAAVQIPRPDAALVSDVDPQAARETRQRIFDRVAADRQRVAGAHLDFPGFGYIERRGGKYRFEPET